VTPQTEAGNGGKSTLRKLLVPAAAGVAGTAAAVALTRKPKQLTDAVMHAREALPDVPEGGIGELTDDLRNKLDSVLGKGSGEHDLADFGHYSAELDTAKFEKRRSERRQRREQRRRRAA
jgi:hypothetical protein